MSYQYAIYEKKGHIAYITINRPEVMNALHYDANVELSEIFSDFEVKLLAGASVEGSNSGRQPDGSYHLRFDHALRGTINGGGPEFQFTSFNGQIYIRRKK